MDISTIKTKGIEETPTRAQGGSQAETGLSTFSASFKEFMKAGLGGIKDGKSLIDTSQIVPTASRNAPEPRREPVRETYYDDAPERYGDSRDRLDETGRGKRRDTDRLETRQPDRRDDFTRNQAASREGSSGEDTSGVKTGTRGETQTLDKQEGGKDSKTAENSEKTASNDTAGAKKDPSGGETPLDAVAAGSLPVTSILKKQQGSAPDKAPEEALSAQIAVVQTAVLSGRPGGQTKAKQAETGGRESALNGLAKTLDATAKGPAAKAAVHQGGQNGQPSKTDPNIQNQNRTDPQITANATGKAAQQSADLSRIVGPGDKVSVKVKTTSEAETLISKPKATIVANAAQANETGNKPLRPGGPAQNGAANL
ncbi:MAG TPA: hypothetical protein ENI72_01025, partial [Rhodospirillales bacterium]|nr:hypothetical protein [Rhodospirillales bacterium]